MTFEDNLRTIVREELHSALANLGAAPVRALTTTEAGAILGVVPRVVLEMIRDGELRGWRLHGERGDWRISSRDLERFMTERAEAA